MTKQYTAAMKIPDCVGVARLLYETLRERHRCHLYTHNPHIVCFVLYGRGG
ncbi:MAG: hypothetical protein V7L27_30355 [Nostoc sp.]|uniref:hypothetical protein n=1 Tax=Nostoc sp. TaxID=1180 RepID=UPI002FF82B23